MSRTLVRILVFVGLLATLVAAILILTREKPIAVVVTRAERGSVEQTVANTRAGTIKACRRAKLAPLTSGRVEKLPIKRGDRVQAGQLLLQLWNEDLQAQVQMAQGAFNTAQKRVDEACTMSRWAESELVRQQQLFTDGVTSSQAVERAETEAEARRASCAAASASKIETERALQATRKALERTILKAPFEGVIAELTAELGEIVSPSPPGIPTPPAVDLVDDSCYYVLAPLDEVDAPRVKLGDMARVSLDAFGAQVFAGTVRRVATYVLDLEKQSRTVDIEVEFSDPAARTRLAAGYSADIEIVLGSRENVVRIPTEAVLEGHQVLVVSDGRLQQRAITTGLANWQYTEVLSGLEPGEELVLSLDRPGVRAGAAVTPEAAPASR